MLVLAMAAADRHAVAGGFDVLLHDDGVAAAGHYAARHDAHACAGVDRALERHAGKRSAGDLERDFAVRFKVGKTHCVTVHRRVVVRRHVERRNDVFSEHASKGRADVQAFDDRDRRQKARDELARLGDRHRIGIVIVGATGGADGVSGSFMTA